MEKKVKPQILVESFKRTGPILAIVGAAGAFILDVLQPLMNFAPYLLAISVIGAMIIFAGPFRKAAKERGIGQALNSKIGIYEVFALCNVLLWGLCSALFYYAPEEGYLASSSESLRKIQTSLFHIQGDVKKIKGGLESIDATLGNIEGDLDAAGQGIIENPKSGLQKYHNAKIYEQDGRYEEAKAIYQSLFKDGFHYVDVHEAFQAMIIHVDGKASARKIYEELAQGNPSHPVVVLAVSLLGEDRGERIKSLRSLMEKHADFAPVILELAHEYERVGLGKLSSLGAKSIKDLLQKFKTLDEQGLYAKYFVDKSKLDSRRKIISKLEQTFTIFKKEGVTELSLGQSVKISVSEGSKPVFTFIPADAFVSKILYSIDDPNQFKETGHEDWDDGAGNKMVRTMLYGPHAPDVSAGKHVVYVKYVDRSGNESPVSSQEFEVK